MPEISLFYGIKITMYWDDHNPPHFHAEYGKYKAIFDIDEVMQNWELAKENKPLNRINPLI